MSRNVVRRPSLKEEESDTKVYVSSSSSVYLGSDTESETYYSNSLPYDSYEYYENPSNTLRSICYQGSRDELQELSLWMDGEGEEPVYDSVDPDDLSSQLDDSFDDDSFDSDDAPENGGGAEHALNGSTPPSTSAANRIRESAGEKIRKFRRSWSVTRSDISSKINKIRKRSIVAAQDVMQAKSNSYSEEETASPPRCLSVGSKKSKDRNTWSLKGKLRRSSFPNIPKKEYGPTFYLSLTFQPDSEESDVSNWKSDTESSNTVASSTNSCETPKKTKIPSSVMAPRPKTAPPEPPKGQPPVRPKRNPCCKPKPSESFEGKGEFQKKLNNILATTLESNMEGPGKQPDSEKSSKQSSVHDECHYPCSSENQSRLASSKHFPNRNRQSSKKELFQRSLSSKELLQSSGMDRLGSEAALMERRSSSDAVMQQCSSINEATLLDHGSTLPFEHYEPLEEEPSYMSSHFADEPLYQFYTATLMQRTNDGCSDEEDGYEVIHEVEPAESSSHVRPSAMELVGPYGPQRTLWCELKEVKDSGILDKISTEQKKLQEAIFELITSEASYLKSLHVLVTHFMNSPRLAAVLSKRDSRILFSDIIPVKEVCERLLSDLEARWQESVYIADISDILYEHASKHFYHYVKYCSNQVYQDRLLNELKSNNPEYLEVVRSLESAPLTQSLSMHSFLMLPMQRITRLPLLVDAIYHRLDAHSPYLQTTKRCLKTLNKIVHECNEGARKMERMQEMLLLSQQLDWGDVKALPLISASRWLVKRGQVTQLVFQNGDTYLRTQKFRKMLLHLFLFTDLLVVTKKKSHEEERYLVLDHCPRNMVQVSEAAAGLLPSLNNLMMLTMLCNRQEKTKELLLSCPLESERSRWIEAVTPKQSENPQEIVYEDWDCPQVQAVHAYTPVQPDELSLNPCDVVKVLKKTADGWYHGERLQDGARGWFPGNYSKEVCSAHVRARFLRQRYRLLQLSESFLEKARSDDERKSNRRRHSQCVDKKLSFTSATRKLSLSNGHSRKLRLPLNMESKNLSASSRENENVVNLKPSSSF